jgi:hypothetical protein
LLHAILEESPSEDDLASNEEESSGYPLLRVCNTMIPVTPLTTTPLTELTPMFQIALMKLQRTTTLTALPEQMAAHPEG